MRAKFVRRTRNGARLCEGPRGCSPASHASSTCSRARMGARAGHTAGSRAVNCPRSRGKQRLVGQGSARSPPRQVAQACARKSGQACARAWGEASQGASVCPRGVVGIAAPKNSAPKVVGGTGEVRSPGSEWGEALREASLCPRGVAGIVAPKNSAPKSGGH